MFAGLISPATDKVMKDCQDVLERGQKFGTKWWVKPFKTFKTFSLNHSSNCIAEFEFTT